MKIAYNPAYIQIVTLNFTFAQQAFIVYFYRVRQACSQQWSIITMATTLSHIKFCCIHWVTSLSGSVRGWDQRLRLNT